MLHARADYMRIQDPAGLIPVDEPVFLIRGQESVGPAAVLGWAELATVAGASEDIIAAARDQAVRMRLWQADHGRKVPDMPGPEPDRDVLVPADSARRVIFSDGTGIDATSYAVKIETRDGHARITWGEHVLFDNGLPCPPADPGRIEYDWETLEPKCPRSCSACGGDHHWLVVSEHDEREIHPAANRGHRAWYSCKHCDVWTADERAGDDDPKTAPESTAAAATELKP